MTTLSEFFFHFTAQGHHCAAPFQDLSDRNFHASIERIEELSHGPGSPPVWAHDLLHVARSVYLAVKWALRRFADDQWTRTINLTVQVIEPASWNPCLEELQQLLSLLTGDEWRVTLQSGASFHDGGVLPLHSRHRVTVCPARSDDGCRRPITDKMRGRSGRTERVLHVSAVLVPYHITQDEEGVWCAEAIISERVGATAYGGTRNQALTELQQAVIASFEADGGIPPHLARVDALAVEVPGAA